MLTFVQKPAGVGVYLGIGFLLLIAIMASLDLIPRAAFSEGGLLYIDNGPALYLMAAFNLSLVGASLYFLAQYRSQVTSSLTRTRIAYLIMGLTVVSLISLTNLSTTLGKYPFGNLGNLGNAIIISYAILKYELLDIRFVLRRSLAYLALSTLLTTGYALALYLIVSFSSLTIQGSMVLAVALALADGPGFRRPSRARSGACGPALLPPHSRL